MAKSRAKRSAASGAGKGGGGRLQTVGLFLTLLAVAVLVGSLAAGLFGGRGRASRPAPADAGAGSPGVATAAPAGRIRVEVLNASGKPGLAAEGRRVLRDRGFDVLGVGNAGAEFGPDSSIVLDRVGRIEMARAVADSVGIRRVVSRPQANLYLDVTVVLGRDWQVPGATPP